MNNFSNDCFNKCFMLNISFRILLLENEKLSMQETLVMMSVRHCTRPSTRPHVRTGREGLSGHEFQPSSPRELVSLLFQKALQLST